MVSSEQDYKDEIELISCLIYQDWLPTESAHPID